MHAIAHVIDSGKAAHRTDRRGKTASVAVCESCGVVRNAGAVCCGRLAHVVRRGSSRHVRAEVLAAVARGDIEREAARELIRRIDGG